ncbi:MAG: amino acid adenylation domain-containing protein [Flavobacteriales bacterium]|nr:amino acid adenylation domain-containing protein [Flavobacteriales bacterium]
MSEDAVIESELTQSQTLIWTGQLLNPEVPLYNMALTFELNGEIDSSHFQAAFDKLVEGTDALRTTFSNKNGMPKQLVLSKINASTEFIDWAERSIDSQNLEDYLSERSQRNFDLTEVLFDSVLIKTKEDCYTWYFNQHHLITDGWSVTVLYKKMQSLYDASLNGLLEDCKALPSYSNYIAFEQKEREKFQAQSAEDNYWKVQLKHLPVAPTLYACSNTGTRSDSQRISISLGQERSDQLRKLTEAPDLRAWTQHLSLFNIFSTTLFAYLHRVSGQQELAIGTPSHNRLSAGFKETSGLFIELFPIITAITDEESFSSLFKKVQIETFDFLKHATPGAATSELSRGFNVVLNYINATFSDFNGIPMKSDWVHPNHADQAHVMRLQVHDFDDSGVISLHFDVNITVFEEELRNDIPAHFLKVLDAFIKDRTAAINATAMVEAESIVGEQKGLNYKSVVGLFEEQVKQSAQENLIDYQGGKFNFETVNQKANQLANYLTERGLKKGDRVGLYLKRTPQLIVSILATLKAGAIYVPLDTSYSGIRTTDIVEDADLSFLLTTKKLSELINYQQELNCVELDEDELAIQNQSSIYTSSALHEKDLAYIMYTSGSTGKPKGVMISHGALANYISYAAENYKTLNKISTAFFTAIGFDLTITSLFLPIVSGGTINVYEEPENGPDLSLFQVLEENKSNFIKLTPSHLVLLGDKEYPLSKLEVMIVGGEDFKLELGKSIQSKFGENLAIYNEYGPTEATVGCVVHQFDIKKDYTSSVSIGKPITNTSYSILDEVLHPVPKGVSGELYIAGAGLAEGYWNQKELTDNSFINKPFEDGSKIYKTGDLVRLNEVGDLEYLGRIDEQVKISGRRIELGEIESALNRLEGVETSIVELRSKDKTARTVAVENCKSCGLPSSYPNIEFDDNKVCNLCNTFESYQSRVEKYFKNSNDFKALFDRLPRAKDDSYDCIALLSGGKDSTYVLAKLVEMGLKVLAFTLDNGYISEQAKENIRRIVAQLDVAHEFGETPAMNEIFVDSLKTHQNVCDGCFKTIYTLSTKVALEKNIPFIVTGLSRGQFFETRLTEELFWNENADIGKIDKIILEARKSYHRVDDAVNRLLDVSAFKDDGTFEKVQFLDYFRYTDVSLDEMLSFLDKKLNWVRPTDTGRSTNCLINQAGIFIHKKEKGYSNYAFPYSWDVRLGHKTRDASLEEINEEIDEKEVARILEEIGYTEQEENTIEAQQLVAYYVSQSPVEDRLIRSHLEGLVADYMIPVQFIHLEELPISSNGKVDKLALPVPDAIRPITAVGYVAPRSDIEEILVDIWSEVLQIDKIGIYDKFLELGGSSLAAIRIITRANESFNLELPLNLAFSKPTIAAFSEYVRETIMKLLEEMHED